MLSTSRYSRNGTRTLKGSSVTAVSPAGTSGSMALSLTLVQSSSQHQEIDPTMPKLFTVSTPLCGVVWRVAGSPQWWCREGAIKLGVSPPLATKTPPILTRNAPRVPH